MRVARAIRSFAAAALLWALPAAAIAQTSPNWTYGFVPTTAQWNALWASKQDTLGFVPMNTLGGTFTGRIVTAAPSASLAGFNLTPGSTPSSPANGDLWATTTGLFARINGSTIGPLAAGPFTPNLPLIGAGTANPAQGTVTGNTTKFATGSGSYIPTNCIKADANGNLVDAGAPCGVGTNVSYAQDFLAGVDFTAGTTTSLTVSNAPTTQQSTAVYFDGVRQSANTWSLSGSTVTFSAAIPTNTQVVEIASLSASVLPTFVTSLGGLTGVVGCSLPLACGSGAISYALPYKRTRDFVRSVLPSSDGVCDGTTNVLPQIQAALNAAAGGALLVEGLCALSGPAFPQSFTRIFSNDKYINGFVMTAASTSGVGLLQISNIDGYVTIDSLRFGGNSQSQTGANVGAIYIAIDKSRATDMHNVEIKNSFFTRFNHGYYIWQAHESHILNLANIIGTRITDNIFEGIGGPQSDIGGTFIGIWGNLSHPGPSTVGVASDLTITGNTGLGNDVCSFVSVLYGALRGVISNNIAYAMGASVLETKLCYPFLIYASAPGINTPKYWTVSNNVSMVNHAMGLYVVGATGVSSSGNVITDTFTSSIAPSLSHGAGIGFNGCIDCSSVGDVLINNFGGIAVSTPDTVVSAVTVTNPTIHSTVSSTGVTSQLPYGIIYTGVSTTPDETSFTISGGNIVMSGNNSIGIGFNGEKAGRFKITGAQISANLIGYTEIAPYTGTSREFASNRWSGPLFGPYAISLGGSSTPLSITNETVDFSQQIAGGGYRASGETGLMIRGLTLRNKTAGSAALDTTGSQGVISGVTFPGVTVTQVEPSSLGLAQPAFSAKINSYVQNLAPSVVGTTPNSYWVRGWMNLSGSTTWVPDRTGLF